MYLTLETFYPLTCVVTFMIIYLLYSGFKSCSNISSLCYHIKCIVLYREVKLTRHSLIHYSVSVILKKRRVVSSCDYKFTDDIDCF